MITLPQRIQAALGHSVHNLSRLSGGCIADVLKADLDDGSRVVIKTGNAGSGLQTEARMLRYLGTRTELPVPDVHHSEPDLLIMSWLPSGDYLNGRAEEHAADLIAGLHGIRGGHFGFDGDTVIGGLPQPNPKSATWVEFFRNHRLLYMATEAHANGRLPPKLMTRLERFSATLPDRLTEPAFPALVHGDLWGGNILCFNGRISGIIDPAIYFAHPEIELAFTTLFSTFGDRFFRRYRDHHTLVPGFFEERRDIYNLYPLLVHARLFGGSYVARVDRTLRQFGY